MINVTKTTLPPLSEYISQLEKIWSSGHLTNNGTLLRELETRLKEFLGVRHLFMTANGTLALQLAIRAMNLTGEVITTPFSYVATVNSLLWENCQPVFVDIDHRDFCLDPELIEAAITPQTQAILAVHVYGNPCHVVRIQEIAARHGLKVIYDAAHSFGARLNGSPLVVHGDASVLSFHATKLFHTVEGGAVITDDDQIAEKVRLMRAFGHFNDDYYMVGINAKNSEFHAAMGLCLLPRVAEIISARQEATEHYDRLLDGMALFRPKTTQAGTTRNYAYYPVVFPDEASLLRTRASLNDLDIYPRRYFYPALNLLPFIQDGAACPIAEDIARRVLCLPLFGGLAPSDQEQVVSVISQNLG